MVEARSKSSLNRTNCVLPEELVFNVLTLLPVISLLRFKSVCKSWLSIISSPQFMETHLIESRKKQPSPVLKVVDKSVYVDTCDSSALLHVLKYNFYGRIDSVCSCNGLVCLANDRFGDVIYLLNPMTKRCKKLPAPTQQPNCQQFLFGFGFDDISNDYKILRIAPMYFYMLDDDDVCALQVDMYSANNDSWKEIQVPEALENFYIHGTVCVHLKGSRLLFFEGTYQLLSFDLHDEVFRVYPYPISPLQFEQRKSLVLDLEGSVGMIFNESVNEGSVSTLWRLDDVCGNWSWTKVFILEYSLKKYQVITLYLGDGKFFGRDSDAGEYIFCDYKKKYDNKFGAPPPRKIGSIVKYNESLVSLRVSTTGSNVVTDSRLSKKQRTIIRKECGEIRDVHMSEYCVLAWYA